MSDGPLPQCATAERALLSCILQDVATCLPVATARLRDEVPFHDPRHRWVFRACATLGFGASGIDVVRVATLLDRWGKLAEAGEMEYLAQLLGEVPTTVGIADYCELVMDAHILRCLALYGAAVTAGAYGPAVDADAGIRVDAAKAALDRIHALRRPPQRPSLRDIAGRLNDRVEAVRRGEARLVPWHIDWLDSLIPLLPGRFAVVGGRTMIGKTATAVSCAVRQAIAGVPVGIICFEMAAEDICQRAVSMLSGIPFGMIGNGLRGISKSGLHRYAEAMAYLPTLPLHLACGGPMTLAAIEQQTREWVNERNIGCVWVDYLQQVVPESARVDKRFQVGAISTGLRNIALAMRVPLVAMSQLNRQAAGERPQLQHLAESTQIEMDADYVTLLHRPDADGNDAANRDKVVLDVAKNRHGATGSNVDDFHSSIMCIGRTPRLPGDPYRDISDADIPPLR